MSALRDFQAWLEAPFVYDWAVGPPDERPFGPGSWLPIMGCVYLFSLTVLKLLAGATWLQGSLKALAFVNNVVMCVYSTWCMLAVGAGALANWQDTGYSLTAPVCDPSNALQQGLDFQFYIFFLSKFWEWIDTYVLVLKGKGVWPPSNTQFMLHIFHHTTTATVGWLAWRGEITVAWVGPLSNAFVHMLMYGYYAIVTVSPGFRKYGLLITPVQIIQFIICLLSFVPDTVDMLLTGGETCGASLRAVVWMVFAYSTYLVFFILMFQNKKAAARAAKAAKAKQN